MKTSRAKNLTLLENINEANPVVFPQSAYLDYADYTNETITVSLVKTVDNTYFARFNTEEEFFEAVQQDFGKWAYPTIEDARNDFFEVSNRYYKKA